MRVLALTNNYPPHSYGGYELSCRDALRRLVSAGHDVQVLTSDVRVEGVSAPDEGVVTRTLHAYWDWNVNVPVVPRSPTGRLRVERHNLAEFRRVVHDFAPDVLSVWNMCGLSMSMLTEAESIGLPMVLTVHNDWPDMAPRQDGWLRMWPSRLPAPRTVGGVPTRPPALSGSWAVFVSRFTERSVDQRTRIRFREAEVCPVGVDLDDFPILAPRNRRWGWRLLYVGRVDAGKGIPTLVRALAQLPAEAKLTIVGGSATAHGREVRDLAQQLGVLDRVTFASVPRSALAEHYLGSDVVVFPSEWEEPFGLVPLEAMACGTPVVSTQRGGSAEFLVDRVNCLAFGAGDVEGLAAAVRELSASPALRRQVTAGGSETARTLTIEAFARREVEIHEAAVDQLG